MTYRPLKQTLSILGGFIFSFQEGKSDSLLYFHKIKFGGAK